MADMRTLMDYNAIAYMADRYGDFTPDVNEKIIRWSQNQDVFYTREGQDFLRRLSAINRGIRIEEDCVICGRKARNGVVCGRCIDRYIEIDEQEEQEDDEYEEPIEYKPQYGSNGQRRKQQGSQSYTNKKSKNVSRWATGKLVISIISIVLFMVVMLQSCAAGLSNAIENNGESSGTFGFLCAILLLIAGIVGIVVRKKGLGANISVCVFYYLVFLFAATGAGTYSDLKVWGVLGFIFGTVFLFSAINSRNGYIIGGIVSGILFILCIIIMVTASKSNGNKTTNGNLSDISVSNGSNSSENGDNTNNNNSNGSSTDVSEKVNTSNELSIEIVDTDAAAFKDYFGEPTLSAYIKVRNNNDVPITFSNLSLDFEDNDGNLIGTDSMPNCIPRALKPGQEGYIYTYYYSLSGVNIDNGFNLRPNGGIVCANNFYEIEVSDISAKTGSGFDVSVIGRGTNNTGSDKSLAQPGAIFFGTDGKVLGFCYGLENFTSGQTTTFEISGDMMSEDLDPSLVDHVEVYIQGDGLF